VPSVALYRTVDEKVNLAELCAGKRVVIVGIPGAYTPTCSTVRPLRQSPSLATPPFQRANGCRRVR